MPRSFRAPRLTFTLALLLIIAALAAPARGQWQDENALSLRPVQALMAQRDNAARAERGSLDPANAASNMRTNAGEGANGPFREGTWSLEPISFALFHIRRGPRVELYASGLSAGYYFADNVAVRGEVFGVRVNQTGDNAVGGGASLHGRWHFYRRERFTLFFEGGGGLLQTTTSVPDGSRAAHNDGTHFNFMATTILGSTYELEPNLHLTSGFRYTHISNARRHGEARNPGTEAIGGFVGLMWTF